MQQPPPKWEDDELTRFITNAIENTFATFHNKKQEFELLLELDSCFQLLIPNMHNRPEVIPTMLMARSHSSYRGAVRLALSGQCAETFALLRSCIECSLYALRIYKKPELEEAWLRRHDDEMALKVVKREFSYGAVLTALKEDDRKLATSMDALYQRCIDFGGHPNEMAITSNMQINELEKATEYLQVYLSGNDMNLAHALKSTTQIGIGVLYAFRHIYKERFDILGVTARIDLLRSKL